MLSYTLIKKDDAYLVPMESILPAKTEKNLHFFIIGLREIEEEVNGIKPKKCSVSFDVSGD